MPYLISEGVLVPADQQEISSAATFGKKAQVVLGKISATLDARFTEPFYKLITVMKSHGNNALQKLASIIEDEIANLSTANDARKFYITSFGFMHALSVWLHNKHSYVTTVDWTKADFGVFAVGYHNYFLE